MAVEADSAPFGKDDTVTAYLVSFLNLLNRVQSCDDNNLSPTIGEFEIVTIGFAIVDSQSQLLIMKGEICSSYVMKAIKQSVAGGKISPEPK